MKTVFIVKTDICTMTEEKAISLGLSREWDACVQEWNRVKRWACTCPREEYKCFFCGQTTPADPPDKLCRKHGRSHPALEELNQRVVLLWNEGVNIY